MRTPVAGQRFFPRPFVIHNCPPRQALLIIQEYMRLTSVLDTYKNEQIEKHTDLHGSIEKINHKLNVLRKELEKRGYQFSTLPNGREEIRKPDSSIGKQAEDLMAAVKEASRTCNL